MARVSLFPQNDLFEALIIAKTIWNDNAGKPMRRLTIFDNLKKSPDSGTSRGLITSSSGYGLTQGGYNAEIIKLTERGQAIVENNDAQSMIDAVLNFDIFNNFFTNYKNATLPSTTASIDYLKSFGISDQSAKTCLDVLIKCGEQVALIQEISGAKRIVSPDYALEQLSKASISGIPILPERKQESEISSSEPIIPQKPNTGIIHQGTVIPTFHIDIQIHISADAKPEQIDQIFASMAKYLYNKG